MMVKCLFKNLRVLSADPGSECFYQLQEQPRACLCVNIVYKYAVEVTIKSIESILKELRQSRLLRCSCSLY